MVLDVSAAARQAGVPLEFTLAESMPSLSLGEESYPQVGEVEVKGSVTAFEDKLVLSADARARVEYKCARCLGDVIVPLAARIEETFVREADERNPEFILFEGWTLDITDCVIAALNLELPMRALCAPDCPGVNGILADADAPRKRIDNPFAALNTIVLDDKEEI